jgi:branched-chain amino acid transport system permease protein
MGNLITGLRKNRTQLIVLAILLLLVITLLRGLSVGAITFIVASGFSLIFGLLDVLNLAHGTLFMVGAYVGWTVFVRPDTFVDAFTPAALLLAAFILLPVWRLLFNRLHLPPTAARALPWLALIAGAVVLFYALPGYPVSAWNASVYERSPITYAFQADQGTLVLPPGGDFKGSSPLVIMGGILLGGLLAAGSIAAFGSYNRLVVRREENEVTRIPWRLIATAAVVIALGLLFYLVNDPLTNWLMSINHTWLFFLALLVSFGVGTLLGLTIEVSLIRPLYSRPIYQLMMTLGVSAIGIEAVRAVWGRPEFTMPKPPIFSGSGAGCPANSLADLLANQCSTIFILGGRVRTYNEIFVPLVGVLVLVVVWVLLQRSRLGMIIRAGVQDSEMVEALGINVRRVFTLVFAMGVGLAAMGGVIAGPSMGLATTMGETLLLNALIALAIGGLTSFPGAAAGSLLVGLMQQFIIKYGSIGIQLPFMEAAFKPTPPLVPASTVLLMVVVLLVLPHGLFGRKE